jgi:hypothetical protein
MSFSHSVTVGVQTSSGGVTKTKSYSGSSETLVSESFPTATTDGDIVVAIDVSAVKSFYLVSDKAVTVETNDGSSPDDTIVLKADVPYFWNTDSYDTFLLTADVTVLYITNVSGSTASIELRVIQDASP